MRTVNLLFYTDSMKKIYIFPFLLVVAAIAVAFLAGRDMVNKISASTTLTLSTGEFTPLQSKAHVFTLFTTPTPTPSDEKLSGYCLYVPVLMYHHVQPESVAVQRGQTGLTVDPSYFDQQMNYIATHGYTTITAEQLVLALRNHTGVPPKSIVVTLDDGYQDNFDYAFPIFQKYHLIGNLMVATGLLGGVGNNTYYTWDELKQMVQSGLIYTTDHTWSHYPMGSSTPDKDQMEIMTAKEELESHLGNPQTIFTYPYGTGYNNPRVTQELMKDGFLGAYSTVGGSWQCDSYIYALRRIHIGNAPLSAYGL